jgi:hypothetical protein
MSKSKQHYDDCVIAFVDILGFRNLVLDSEFGRIRSIVGLLKWQLDSGHVQTRNPSGSRLNDREVVSQKSVFFSDNVVVISHFEKSNRKQKLVEVISRIKMAQMKLGLQGIWIRGGISTGEIFHKRYHNVAKNDDMIFGPGLIEAYRIESEVARYPRVVVESTIADEIVSAGPLSFNHGGEVVESFIGSDILSEDTDGKYFINFLSRKPMLFDLIEDTHFGLGGRSSASIGELMTPGSDYQNQLFDNAIKRINVEIETALSKPDINQSVLDKLLWLKMYASKHGI